VDLDSNEAIEVIRDLSTPSNQYGGYDRFRGFSRFEMAGYKPVYSSRILFLFLLWAALRHIAENEAKSKAKNRPHVLLLDETELCLHPTAVREACKVLYDLPKTGNWQVMVTTHSPTFIDVPRDNTTIIRVERNLKGEIQGTTLFRPKRAKLDENDRVNLKLLNICDPYVAEFFFGGRTVIVEGDTEYTAFKQVIDKNRKEFGDVHIIRARGKATIVSLVKILNHFGSNYAVLHDSDSPKTTRKDGKEMTNPAWSNNKNILDAVLQHDDKDKVRLLASLPNFEGAYFGEEVAGEKPYNALLKLQHNEAFFKKVEDLLRALVDPTAISPKGCIEWRDSGIDVLQVAAEKAKQVLV
jgi:putative ATP-dependent endonuclease of the OLD family